MRKTKKMQTLVASGRLTEAVVQFQNDNPGVSIRDACEQVWQVHDVVTAPVELSSLLDAVVQLRKDHPEAFGYYANMPCKEELERFTTNLLAKIAAASDGHVAR
jgi:hypothetical protein